MDLSLAGGAAQTGQLITSQGGLNWTTQTQIFNYTTYGPNLIDYANYVAVLNSTLARVQGLAYGDGSGNNCMDGDSRLDRRVLWVRGVCCRTALFAAGSQSQRAQTCGGQPRLACSIMLVPQHQLDAWWTVTIVAAACLQYLLASASWWGP